MSGTHTGTRDRIDLAMGRINVGIITNLEGTLTRLTGSLIGRRIIGWSSNRTLRRTVRGLDQWHLQGHHNALLYRAAMESTIDARHA